MANPTYQRLSIMQPTFLPWSGYFAIMLQSDAFVFLDSVQFAKRSWQQRNRIITANGPDWVTVPVFSKGESAQLIQDVQIDTASDWQKKAIRTIQQNYSKAPYFKQYSEELFTILSQGHQPLFLLNQELIFWMMHVLSIKLPITKSSDLNLPGTRADLLANICEHYQSKIYVSAAGSKEYIDQSTAFQDKGIEVVYNRYLPKPYAQLYGKSDAYVSAIDLIFNLGPAALDHIKSGLI
jgi:hypothetical protein